ncbi:PRC-barrel domain-containing protein [Patescibacteria group bacterium]|nr:PRC-barrel domain-containing protein [Patescibacteria group bacterium]
MKHSQVTKLAVVSISSGENLGKIADLVINSDGGQCLALLIQPEGILVAKKIILIDDVSDFGDDVVMVQNEKMVVPFRDNEDLKQIVDQGAKIIDNEAITYSGELLGEVKDYEVDEESNKISRLFISTGLIKDLFKGELIITADKIVSIGKDAIIVKDAVVTEKLKRKNINREKDFAQLGAMNKDI